MRDNYLSTAVTNCEQKTKCRTIGSKKFLFSLPYLILALDEDEFEKLQKIAVTGMLADPAYHGHPYTTIDKAFEGSDSWDHAQCYVSNPNGKAQASIDIEPATVYQIKLLNRGDCCSKYACF